MKKIQLTQGYEASVDDSDYEWLLQWKWHARTCSPYRPVAVRANYHDRKMEQVLMHREIMRPGPDYEVDHIDGNTLNNCRCNLRVCTRSENMRNYRKHVLRHSNSSHFKGVSPTKDGKWMARITKHYDTKYLGTYTSELQAAIAYNYAAEENFGEFCHLNVIHY